MRAAVAAFNAKVPWPLRMLVVAVLGIVLWALTIGMLPGLLAKVTGQAPECSWARILAVPWETLHWNAVSLRYQWSVRVAERDPKLDIERFSSPWGSFWLPAKGTHMDGPQLLAYLLTEHSVMQSRVRPGDIVLDCGAHIGVFTASALAGGAGRVVAIEPDARNLECLRRNFSREIAAGRVIVVPKGVWSEEKTLTLFAGAENSGMNSVIENQGAGRTEILVTTIDKLVRELGLPRVTYIKMDIEGAEREALKGAVDTLRRYRPRLMLDSYHRPDDMQVLPGILRSVHADYRLACGPCQPHTLQSASFVPHVTHYE